MNKRIFDGFTLAKNATHVNLPPTKVKFGFTLAEGATHVDLPPTKVKFAFTLAEVLITLGIIGVVAAITIPGLMTKYHRHVVETKLAKFDSIINQAVRMSIAENDDILYDPPADKANSPAYLKEWFDENLLKYMKADYDSSLVDSSHYKINFLDGTGFVAYINANSDTMHFFYCLNAGDKSCKPQSYDGKNTFVFYYYPKEKSVLPYGDGIIDMNTLKYSTGNSSTGCYVKDKTTRHYCAQLIKLNGWKIPSDYPWIK